MEYLIGIIVLAVIIMAAIGKTNNLKNLKQQYDTALRGTDKRAALDAGRAYYKALRGKNTLTIYDEQALTNDLSTMR